jgi:hypothetical protein
MPIFLHLGGFGNHILATGKDNVLYKDFYKNLLNLAAYYDHIQEGE